MGQGNASYWEDRAERLLKAREAMTAEQQQILADALQAAQREIEAGIEKFCRRYAKNNKVTYAQAQKALSLKELARQPSATTALHTKIWTPPALPGRTSPSPNRACGF